VQLLDGRTTWTMSELAAALTRRVTLIVSQVLVRALTVPPVAPPESVI
jgi:hypothetical protein